MDERSESLMERSGISHMGVMRRNHCHNFIHIRRPGARCSVVFCSVRRAPIGGSARDF